ncbi:hypothetical protein JY651_25875 [Pyxidicoccus parkwayensis]|uniref:Lipoprotein n=1 Tax=Pyxidicoccus parkwayensis TaxID=2813578 RepID=A0ABX7NIX9_9BACT|nr:hypothetical protein [Pyxidicoccus parkwaysis]QSQ18791.1 hypothetical protein JY651_25875 [Pyxidicoccus parkwaysis]
MKNVFVAVAVMFSVSLLGCGGPEAEPRSEELAPTTGEVSASALRPNCADIDLTACQTQGAIQQCTMVGRPAACVCNGTQWICP